MAESCPSDLAARMIDTEKNVFSLQVGEEAALSVLFPHLPLTLFKQLSCKSVESEDTAHLRSHPPFVVFLRGKGLSMFLKERHRWRGVGIRRRKVPELGEK